MYASTMKNAYASKHRSNDLDYFHGGHIHIPYPTATAKSLDLPKSVYLTKGDKYEKKFSIRVDLHSKYIEIPLSMSQLQKWFAKIEEEDAEELKLALEEEREAQREFFGPEDSAELNHPLDEERETRREFFGQDAVELELALEEEREAQREFFGQEQEKPIWLQSLERYQAYLNIEKVAISKCCFK